MLYRRASTAGGTYFFTVVTYDRRPILTIPENVALLRSVFRAVMARHTFSIDAFVLLPDHLHCLWTLPLDDADFATRWRLIKSAFTRQCDERYRLNTSTSRLAKAEQAVWQRRYWEHLIRDADDFRRHVEYIHYNPVKHGVADSAAAWPYSSMVRHVRAGVYPADWGGCDVSPAGGME